MNANVKPVSSARRASSTRSFGACSSDDMAKPNSTGAGLPLDGPGKRAAADDALRAAAGPLSKLAVRGDEPVRREASRLARDPVVGAFRPRPDDVPCLFRAASVEDDERLVAPRIRPTPGAHHQHR